MNNNSTSKTHELAEVSRGTRVLTNGNIRNSWASSCRVLGNVVELDEWLDWRVKWGQRWAAVCALGALAYVINAIFFGGHSVPLFVATIVCIFCSAFATGLIYYKNISFVIARRLLKEVNVVLALMFGVCIFIIDCAKPYNSFSPINGFIYLVMLTLFLFLDAVIKKSRVFAVAIGIVSGLLNVYLVTNLTFGEADIGVILIEYGDGYVLRKRSVKRSCFIQIFLLGINGMWTMFWDKKMEMMMFATGNIYRETGTASKYVEDREHGMRMRSEAA
jgi:hypothetical protein